MNITKKVIGKLEKCYSLAMLSYNNQKHFLVAAEKVNKCLLFDLDGNLEETVWEQPGGVMSMVQVPKTNGEFLATHKFYSPNDSKDARIVIVTPRGKNDWEVRTLVEVPFVHRFDILNCSGVNYLIVCTLKSGHEYKEDWSNPGKVYAAVLPDDLSSFGEEKQLKLEVVKDNMLKNHGYYRHVDQGKETAVISCEQGVFQFTPPQMPNDTWLIKQLIDTPASDALLIDLDEDGEEELFVMTPFHGETIEIFKKDDSLFKKVYEYPEKVEFLHAIFGGRISGIPTVVVGHRQGKRRLLSFRSDKMGSYAVQTIDENAGAANVLHYEKDGKDFIIATNREIDEIAIYICD